MRACVLFAFPACFLFALLTEFFLHISVTLLKVNGLDTSFTAAALNSAHPEIIHD